MSEPDANTRTVEQLAADIAGGITDINNGYKAIDALDRLVAHCEYIEQELKNSAADRAAYWSMHEIAGEWEARAESADQLLQETHDYTGNLFQYAHECEKIIGSLGGELPDATAIHDPVSGAELGQRIRDFLASDPSQPPLTDEDYKQAASDMPEKLEG